MHIGLLFRFYLKCQTKYYAIYSYWISRNFSSATGFFCFVFFRVMSIFFILRGNLDIIDINFILFCVLIVWYIFSFLPIFQRRNMYRMTILDWERISGDVRNSAHFRFHHWNKKRMEFKRQSDCTSLPPGWRREEVVRQSGLSAGKTDVYYYR